MRAFAIYRELLLKDLLSASRARAFFLSTCSFALLLVVVASFAFRRIGFGPAEMSGMTPGVLWLVFLFTGVITLNRSFGIEVEDRAITGMLLTPLHPSQLFLSKWSLNFTLMLAVQTLVVTAHGLLFSDAVWSVFPQLLLLTAIGGIGFAALGTLFSGMAAATSGRDSLLPILLFPLIIPLLAALAFLTQQLVDSGRMFYSDFWFIVALVFDVVSLTLGIVLFEYVVRE